MMTISEREAKDAGIDVVNMVMDEETESGTDGEELTALAICCEVFGWQGGTIHQAKERAAVASLDELDRLCSQLSRRIGQISDPGEALWFMRHRMQAANGLHVVGVRQ